MPDPFMIIATQNPVEFVGTYPLPEAQLDRFMMKLSIGYPSPENELILTRNFLEGRTVDKIKSVAGREELKKAIEEAGRITISDKVLKYAGDIVSITREESRLVMGVSPRALIMMVKAAMAKAYLSGRDHCIPDDIKTVAVNCLHHRVSLTHEAKMAGEKLDTVLYSDVLKAKVPIV
jgi:MoxR-like ATPase